MRESCEEINKIWRSIEFFIKYDYVTFFADFEQLT